MRDKRRFESDPLAEERLREALERPIEERERVVIRPAASVEPQPRLRPVKAYGKVRP